VVATHWNILADAPEERAWGSRFSIATRRQHVEVSRILDEIDSQISKLQQARELLSGTAVKVSKGRGRPKGSKNAKTAAKAAPRKRKISAEGRKRIAEAMKKRWAERRKLAAAAK
jgi:hypothetical protein